MRAQLAFAAVLMCATTALAQQTGTIIGSAEDANGAPVSGIRVTLSGPDLIGGPRQNLTTTAGAFRFAEVPPGTYQLTADAEGFATIVQKGIAVTLGQTVELTLLVEVKTGEEVVPVTAKGAIVDTKKVDVGQTLSDSLLEDIPTGRSYQSTAHLLPGVTGGSNPTIHGGSLYSNQYLVDGVNTTDPTTNTFSLNFNFDAIDELEIITAGFSPEYGNLTGGVINVVTKSGSNQLHLDSSIYYQSQALMMKGLDESDRQFYEVNGNVNVGGPIVMDKLWYFVSMEYRNGSSQLPAESSVPDLDGYQHPARTRQSLFWLGKLSYAPTSDQRVTVLVQGDPAIFNNVDQDPTQYPSAETHQDQGGVLASLRWDGLFDPFVFKVQGAYKQSTLDVFPQSRVESSSPFRFGRLSEKNQNGRVDGCLGANDRADAATFTCGADAQASPEFGRGLHIDVGTGATYGGSNADVYIERSRWQLTPTASYFLDDVAGSHTFKVGADVALMRDVETARYPGGAAIFVDADQDGDGTPDPLYARITSGDDNKLSTTNDGRVFALFLLDKWTLLDRIVVQPGLRIEKSQYENYLGDPVLDFLVASPRFGFSLDPFGDGLTRIHGGYARLYETGNLALSKFVGKSLETRRAYWDATLGRYVEDPDAVSIRGGVSGTAIDPDLKPMESDEFRLGLERALTESFKVGATYIKRVTRNPWEDDEINLIWNQAGTAVVGSYDGTGQQTFRLTSIDAAKRYYDGIEFTAHKRFGEAWLFNGSYTLSWYRGTAPGLLTGAYDNPRQVAYLNGYLPDDHRHNIKLQALYLVGGGLSIGGTYIYETGSPYNKFFMNDEEGDYTNRSAPRGRDPDSDINDPEDDKQLRLPDFTQIDVRVAYSFEDLMGQDLEAILDVFNLLNATTVVGVEERALEGGGFGTPAGRQEPFQAQLSLRYRY